MKRLLKIVGALVVLLIVLAAALIGPAIFGRRSLPEGSDVNGITLVKDGMVGVAIVPLGQGGAALIDAGNDASGQAILDALSKKGMSAKSVTAILITHGHPDHTAAIAQFPEAVVMSLGAEAPLIEGRAAARGPITRLMPAKPTGITVGHVLEDGELFALGADDVMFRVFSVPGHTAGSAAYLVNDTLFLGDAADVGRDGATVQGSPWAFSDDQAQDKASLAALSRRLADEHLTVKTLSFAHSGTLDGAAPLAAFAQANQ